MGESAADTVLGRSAADPVMGGSAADTVMGGSAAGGPQVVQYSARCFTDIIFDYCSNAAK